VALISLRAAVLALLVSTGAAAAQTTTPDSATAPASIEPGWWPRVTGVQVTVIGQGLPPFPARYSGPNSLTANGDQAISDTYGLYLGSHIARGLDAYLDVEEARGKGISRVTGLGGPTNGDVIRQGSADLGTAPYVARAFLRYVVGLGPRATRVDRGEDQLAGMVPDRRIEISVGKLAASDLFDLNRYANSTRTQFMNWSLFQNTAWDFAADTRGYTNGVSIAIVSPAWTARIGSFQMPTKANGNTFDNDIGNARGDNGEITWRNLSGGTVVRLLGYVNHARMGDYQEAIARGIARDSAPDIAADDQPGRVKYGFGLNVEQPLADSGETGVFLRLGWNNGATESFAFAEVDQHFSVGGQLDGGHWGRPLDRVGVALVAHGLSALHREYLELGGSGFLLGDGALNYGTELIVEGYYRWQLGAFVEVSPDVQFIQNPGYNRDRGPATVLSLRLNARY
jgi:hypothetical protein